jgi:peptide/nickel transport system substrate-binding protein
MGSEVAVARPACAPRRQPRHRSTGDQSGENVRALEITSTIVPSAVEFSWAPPPPSYDPARAKALLAEAGYPGGFDAGDYFCDITSTDAAEMMIGFLQAAGIRAKLRPIERAAFNKSIAEKKLRNNIQVIGAINGNAATRLEEFVVSTGTFAYGGYPDLDGLFREQAGELDRAKRQAILHRMQQLVHERAMFAPIYELAFLNGVGSRVAESGFGLITAYAFSAPYEDVTLKRK